MPIEPVYALAVFMPLLFAVVTTAIAWRFIGNRILFFIVSLLVFAAVHDFAFALLNKSVARDTGIDETMRSERLNHFGADLLSGIAGGVIAWRLAKAMRPPSMP